MTTNTEDTTRMTAPEWLDIAKIVSAETRDKIEMATEALEALLLDELGATIVASLAAQQAFNDGCPDIPDDTFDLVSDVVGLSKLRDLFLMLGGAMAGQIDTDPTSEYFAKLCGQYPAVARACGVQS